MTTKGLLLFMPFSKMKRRCIAWASGRAFYEKTACGITLMANLLKKRRRLFWHRMNPLSLHSQRKNLAEMTRAVVVAARNIKSAVEKTNTRAC